MYHVVFEQFLRHALFCVHVIVATTRVCTSLNLCTWLCVHSQQMIAATMKAKTGSTPEKVKEPTQEEAASASTSETTTSVTTVSPNKNSAIMAKAAAMLAELKNETTGSSNV